MDIFTLPQLKTIVKHFNLKNIKITAKKPQLIQQIEQYVHFDGYQFHILINNENNLVKPELLKKQPRQKKTKKPEMDEKGNFEPIEPKPKKKKIKKTDYIPPQQPTKIKKKPVMDEKGNFEPIEPKPKKKK
jgi:hypothetical protein